MPSDTSTIDSPLFVRAGDNGTTWAIAVGSLVLAAGIAARFWKRSRTGFDRERRADLLQGIVDLDTAYEQGTVSKARYEYEREMLKAKLRQWYERTQEPTET
jgi:cbb3-type cytochrome oxidase subunit 3